MARVRTSTRSLDGATMLHQSFITLGSQVHPTESDTTASGVSSRKTNSEALASTSTRASTPCSPQREEKLSGYTTSLYPSPNTTPKPRMIRIRIRSQPAKSKRTFKVIKDQIQHQCRTYFETTAILAEQEATIKKMTEAHEEAILAHVERVNWALDLMQEARENRQARLAAGVQENGTDHQTEAANRVLMWAIKMSLRGAAVKKPITIKKSTKIKKHERVKSQRWNAVEGNLEINSENDDDDDKEDCIKKEEGDENEFYIKKEDEEEDVYIKEEPMDN